MTLRRAVEEQGRKMEDLEEYIDRLVMYPVSASVLLFFFLQHLLQVVAVMEEHPAVLEQERLRNRPQGRARWGPLLV